MATYPALGTCFESPIPLGTTATVPCEDPILVEFDDVHAFDDPDVGHRMKNGAAILDFRPDAVIRITSKTITVFIGTDADDASKSSLVKGVGAGVACLLRGHAVFHAGAWDDGNGAVAVLGDSGAGKSSITAAAMAAGRRIITDDVLCLDQIETPSVFMGFGELRLAPATLDTLGLRGQGPESVGRRDERGRVAWPIDAWSSDGSATLTALYVIRPAGAWSAEAMSPGEATAQLVRHTFAGRLFRSPEAIRRQFNDVTRLADQVPVRWLSRGPLDRIQEAVGVVEQNQAAIGGA